jgi:hypothetical protein
LEENGMAIITKCNIDEVRLTNLVIEQHCTYDPPHRIVMTAKCVLFAQGEPVGEVLLDGHHLSNMSKDNDFMDTIKGIIGSIEESWVDQLEVEEETSTT